MYPNIKTRMVKANISISKHIQQNSAGAMQLKPFSAICRNVTVVLLC